ncbi:TetR/AcrR family transcriptional regulator [Pseudomonas vanderleydeniana]|uniref:TetR/AcrR family transcriptional regulator n=1 Tax=Pseudomonas vanderleydeniana TaxID=2745495 RepID=A0A9E6TQ60_9PSED|nr:TetR/AcrR family transcriptional regulator [Pseudomonas vanderleydeniana]QXI26549.1 TetR/AcrR family transcriptional regulator [Pseudomonas vanderleydeniana]
MASNDLSPAARRIAQLALSHFAEQGYDAASMNDIAVLAGLKKASLYAHFTSKDELYRAALELALAAEAEHVRAQFAAGEGTAGALGEGYWFQLRDRYTANDSLRFLLRAAFYPPHSLRDAVMGGFNDYLAFLRGRFEEVFVQAHPRVPADMRHWLVEAYMAVIDSLHVELIYGNDEGYFRRLEAFRGLYGVFAGRL